MLAKIGKILFAQERISKFKKLSNISFIAGIILLIIYPFLSDNIFIVEKQLKYSEGFTIFQDKEKFFINSKKFTQKTNEWFTKTTEKKKLYHDFNNKQNRKLLFSETIMNFISSIDNPNTNIFKNEINLNSVNEIINTIQIRSQRGEFTKAIIVNFIYDSDKNPSDNSFNSIYAFLKNFENKNFYNYPKSFNEFLKEEPIMNEIFPEFFINIDLSSLGNTFTRSSFYNILMKINGVNSENIDMDYYKIFFDNFKKIINDNYNSNQFSIKTFENKLDFFSNERFQGYIFNIKNKIMKYLNLIIDTNVIKNSIVYRDSHEFYSYLINNIFENYLNFKRQINANDILISEGKLSILLKIDSNKKNNIYDINDFYTVKSFDNDMINFGFNIFCVMERSLKNLNKVEIDIFRGDHNYILTNNNKFQGTGLFILIPVLCVIIIFYEILHKFYMINDIENEIFESLGNNKNDQQNNWKLELESNLNSIFLRDKLSNFASLQIFIVFLLVSLYNLSEFFNIIGKDNESNSYKIYFISFLNINGYNKKFSFIIFFVVIFLLINVLKIILKKFFSNYPVDSKITEINTPFADEFAKKFSYARKKIDNEITNISNLLYLGLNLFLIFFINYALGLIYVLLLMIPEFLLLILENLVQIFLMKKSNTNSNGEASLLSIFLNKLLGFIAFVPITLIMFNDSSNEIIDYLIKIFLNEDGNNNVLRFLYLDILIFYSLKIQKLFEF
jgi:hypothetical protein